MLRTLRIALLTAVAGLALGCEQDSGGPSAGLELEIHPAAWDQGAFDPLTNAAPEDILELIALRPGDPATPAYIEHFTLADRKGKLRDLPIDDGYRLIVRGLRGNPGPLLFYGGSPLFNVEEGKNTRVSIQIGRPDCVMLNHNSTRESFFVVNGKEDTYFKRWGAASVVLPDGRVLMTGGGTVNGRGNLIELRSDIEIYDPRFGQFFFGGENLRLKRPLAHHSATVLKDGRVLIFGGLTTEAMQPVQAPDIQIINVNDTAQPVRLANVEVPMEVRRYLHAAARIEKDGSVLFSGGIGPDQRPTASVVRFFPDNIDPSGGRLVRQADMEEARVYHAMAPLNRDNAPVLVSGGQGLDGEPLDSIEVMAVREDQTDCAHQESATAERGCWVMPTGALLSEPRFGHRAIPVGDGNQILFVGGYASADHTMMAQKLELMGASFQMQGADPAAGEPPVGRLAAGRGDFTATTLYDGRILLTGGRQGDLPVKATSVLKPCHPETGATCAQSFEEQAVATECGLSQARYGHEALRLQNGTVLLIGGVGSVGADTLSALQRAEIFFPSVGQACDAVSPCPDALRTGSAE